VLHQLFTKYVGRPFADIIYKLWRSGGKQLFGQKWILIESAGAGGRGRKEIWGEGKMV
jgi:hypothetical protein